MPLPAALRTPGVRVAAAVFLVAALSSAATAQAPPDSARTASGAAETRHCFVAHRYPVCSTYWVTEFGLGMVLNAHVPWEEPAHTMVYSDLGFMVNVNRRVSLGGTVFGATDADRARAGVRFRYRRWLDGGGRIDISPGVLVVGGDNGPHETDTSYPAFVGTLAVSSNELVQLAMGAEIFRSWDWRQDPQGGSWHRESSTASNVWIGINGGGGLGLAGTLGFFALAALVAATW